MTPRTAQCDERRPHSLRCSAEGAGSIDAGPATVNREHAAGLRRFIPADETIILCIRPSVWFLVLARAEGLAAIVAVSLVGAWAGSMGWLEVQEWTVAAFGVIAFAVLFAWNCVDWLTRLYVLTDRRVLRISGVVRQRMIETPLGRVQSIAMHRGIRERLSATGTLVVASAGEHVSAVVWYMIDQPARVNQMLREAIDRYGGHP